MDEESSSCTLTPLEKAHTKFMKAIVQSMADTPYVLKGGTALMLGYALDRFSEDLDFDSTLKINMESRIKHVLPHEFRNIQIQTVKNTETVQRYKVQYECDAGTRKLKIEISFRNDEIDPQSFIEIDGMNIYKLNHLLDKKLKAAHDGDNPRTVVRDLFDIWFIVRNYKDAVNLADYERLKSFCSDETALSSRYEDAYLIDDLINTKVELDDLVLGLVLELESLSGNFIPAS